MKCSKCNDSNWLIVKKDQTEQEKRNNKEIKLQVCKTCEPEFAKAIGVLGFKSSCEALSDYYNPKKNLNNP